MAFKARLNLSGNKYDMLHGVEIESTEDNSVIESMVNNPYRPSSETFVFKKEEERSTMKALTFDDGYIIHYIDNIALNDKTLIALIFVTICFVSEMDGLYVC